MKYVILIGDGMGDRPCPELGGKTPLEAAYTPHLDRLASQGMLGLAKTIPEGMTPGSDVANMSILGYDPRLHLSGRAPLEAASLGVRLAEDEIAFRLNLVHLIFESGGRVVMGDHSAGNITSEEGRVLVADLADQLPLHEGQKLYPGVSYRHLLTWPGIDADLPTIAPHDHRDQDVTDYLSQTGPIRPILDLIRSSWPILEDHPINRARKSAGLRTANAIWPWGQGRPLVLKTYAELYGLQGAVISAVDLIRGLGVYAGLEPLVVPGATGFLDTNYEGKVGAALENLKRVDLALIHVEAPDEASHQGSLEEKILAIEQFDGRVVGPVCQGLARFAPARLLILCDHYTLLTTKTHSGEPVPFIIHPHPEPSGRAYSEAEAGRTGVLVDPGHALIRLLLNQGA
jgi:2,3-bisphosphoglycerate-independent phosphoglycerate mutase